MKKNSELLNGNYVVADENRKVVKIMENVTYDVFTKEAVYRMHELFYEMVEEEIVSSEEKHESEYFIGRFFKERITLPDGIREIYDAFFLGYVREGIGCAGYPIEDEFIQESEDAYEQLLIDIRKEAEQSVIEVNGTTVWPLVIGEMFRIISDRYIRQVFAR